MPAVSVGVANVGTSVATTTDLTAVVTNSLQEGDLAYIKADGSYWTLFPLSTAVASASVVYADTAQGGTAPGRWMLTNIGPSGSAIVAPLSRTFWCDAATAVPLALQTGSIAQPFATIAQGIAAIRLLPPPEKRERGTLLLAAGDYLEDVVLPDVPSFDRITIRGTGWPNCRIGTGTGSAIRWAPTLGGSPATRWLISDVELLGTESIASLVLDGSALPPGVVPGPGGLPFFPPVFPALNPDAVGFEAEGCIIRGVRCFETGIVRFTDCSITGPPDGSYMVSPVLWCRNAMISLFELCDIGGGDVVVEHTDNKRTTFLSCGLIGSKIVQGGGPLTVTVTGLASFYVDRASFVDNPIVWTPTADAGGPGISFQPLLAIFGCVGFGGQSQPITCTIGDDVAGAPPPAFLAPGSVIGGPLTIDKPLATLGTRAPCNLRGASLSNAANLLTFTNFVEVDLTSAAFDPGQIFQGAGSPIAYVRRRVTYPDASFAGPYPETVVIDPPFPPGTVYAVSVGPSSPVPIFVGAKTNASFDVLDPFVPPYAPPLVPPVTGDITLDPA
jgi:hypothetical protein